MLLLESKKNPAPKQLRPPHDAILQDILYISLLIHGLFTNWLRWEIPVLLVGFSYWAGSDTWKLWGVSFHLGNTGDSHKSRWGNAVLLDISKCMTRYCGCYSFCSGFWGVCLFIFLLVWGIHSNCMMYFPKNCLHVFGKTVHRRPDVTHNFLK